MGREKIVALDEIANRVASLKSQGRRIVFTNGCFDLLHVGHVRLLSEARQLGDVLIVGINSDRSVRALKGDGRPKLPEAERAEILAALECVDYVTIFDDPTPKALIGAILPDVLVKGAQWGMDEIVGREEVEAAGGKVVRVPVTSIQLEPDKEPVPLSTSTLIERIVNRSRGVS